MTYPARSRRRRGPSYGGGLPVVGVCSGASPALMHFGFADNQYYTRTDGQLGVTSHTFADLLEFTGPAGREYTGSSGQTLVAGINQPRIDNFIDTGGGLRNAGLLMVSDDGEELQPHQLQLVSTLAIRGPEMITNSDNEAGLMTQVDGSSLVFDTNGTVAQSSDLAQSGTMSAKYTATSATSTSHYVRMGTVAADQAILVEGWAYIPSSSIGTFRAVDISDGSLLQPLTAVRDQWVFFSFYRGLKGTPWFFAFGNNAPESINGEVFYLDNVSVKTFSMPATITFRINGHMTYEDNDSFAEAIFYDWRQSATERIRMALETAGARTGSVVATQVSGGPTGVAASSQTAYSPGTNVQFSIATRHLATEIGGANDGTLFTVNPQATAIPDLMATALQIVTIGNMNIESMTIWGDDIADAGLVAATTDGSGFNPLCPFD